MILPGPPIPLGRHNPIAFSRSRIAVIAVLIGVVILISSMVIVYTSGDFGTGYRFEVTGTVVYEPQISSGTWKLKDLRYTTPVRDYTVFNTLWSFPWESSNIKVSGSFDGKNSEYSFKEKFSTLVENSKTFTLEYRHVDIGTYTCIIKIIETDCGIIPINCVEHIRATGTITIDVGD